MKGSMNRWTAAAGLVCLAAGIALSHLVEPGIIVERIDLASDTPALRFTPVTKGSHPVALLTHGITASKETVFRYAESLANAGFICYAMDFPGHGQSSQRFNVSNTVGALTDVVHQLGPIDVFIGHSMGAGVGGWLVHEGTFKPGLFIAVGAAPNFGDHTVPLVLLDGTLEEAVPLSRLEAVPNARLQRFTGCDHSLELFDPRIVNAVTAAACESVAKQPPPPPTLWHWRLLGVVLGCIGGIVFGFCVPDVSGRLKPFRGPIFAISAIAAVALTTSTWLGASPTLRRIPFCLFYIAVAWLLILIRNKLRIPRWSFTLLVVMATIIMLIANVRLLPLFTGSLALLLATAGALGKLADRRGSRRDGDFAVAIFVGYALGQWIPMLI